MAPGSFPGKRCGMLPAWRHRHATQAPRGKPGCEGTALHLLCPNRPAKFPPSSPNGEQLAPTHWGGTHHGARAGEWTVTVEELTHRQPTPFAFLTQACLCNHTLSLKAPRAQGEKGCLQHARRVMKPSQTFCKAHPLSEALGEELCLWR